MQGTQTTEGTSEKTRFRKGRNQGSFKGKGVTAGVNLSTCLSQSGRGVHLGFPCGSPGLPMWLKEGRSL